MIRTLLAALALWTAPLAAQVCTQPIVQTGTGYVVRVNGDSVAGYAQRVDATNNALTRKAAAPGTAVTVTSREAWNVDCVPGPVTPPVPPPPSGALFTDTFAGGVRAGPQNGVSWAAAGAGQGDAIAVIPDATNASGYALGATFGGNANPADDATAEQRFTLPKPGAVGLCMEWGVPPNYVHRSVSPANNKLLRIWDADYAKSTVHVGLSLLPNPDGTSKMIVEYRTASGTGNFGTGPWNLAFVPGTVQRIGFYVKVASGVGVKDGVIRVWWNGVKVYDHSDLPLMNASPVGGNWFQNGYLPGWSNSGFAQTTTLRLRKFVVDRQPVAC